jgi:hypothetical protein
MKTATLDRPMESTPVTAPAEPMKALVQDDCGTARGRPTSLSVRKASIVAGTGYLLLSILAGFGNYGVLAHLVTTGNAIKTANAITASKGLFLLGIGSLAAVAVLDVIVALAMLKVFSPVSKRLSRLAAGLRTVYAGVFALAIYQLGGSAARARQCQPGSARCQRLQQHLEWRPHALRPASAPPRLHGVQVGVRS